MRRVISVFIATILVTGASFAPAGADSGRDPDGTLRVRVPLPPQMAAILAEKRQLSNEFAALRSGKGDLAAFRAEFRSFLTRMGEDPRIADNVTQAGTLGGKFASLGASPAAYPTAKYLNVTQTTQSNTYYCGPAAGYSLIAFLGPTTSVYNSSDSLSQGSLALNNYFETDNWGNTPWSGGLKSYPVPYGINRWRQGTDAGYYEPVGFSLVNTTDFENDLQFDIFNGFPLMGDAEERIGAAHLVGHPTSLQIYHWFAIYGYSASGTNTSYADSVAGTTFWTWSGNVPAYSGYDSGTLVTQMLAGRGYVW